MTHIAFIGFGEAASAIVRGWGNAKHTISAFDIKRLDRSTEALLIQRCNKYDVAAMSTAADAVKNAELVFSTVTADQALLAAQDVATALPINSVYFDLNSCAPSSKQAAAIDVEKAGAKYVDVAVMAPVFPALNNVPLLVSGPHASAVLQTLADLPMNPRLIDGPVGAASSIKMIRSIMVKGLEALTAECSLAAVAAGVDQEVFASLNKSHPGSDWSKQSAYNFERSVVHGIRRAAEMEEVAKTLADLNLPSNMVNATIAWQRRLGEVDDSMLDGEFTLENSGEDAKPIADALLSLLRR